MADNNRGAKTDGNAWYNSAGIPSLPGADPANTTSSDSGFISKGNACRIFGGMGRDLTYRQHSSSVTAFPAMTPAQ